MEIRPFNYPVQILVALATVLPAVLCMGFTSAQESNEHTGKASLPGFIEIGGAADLILSLSRFSEGESSTSIAAKQLEVGVGIEPHAWIGSEFGWIREHEEGHGEEEDGRNLGFITGSIVVGPPDGRWWLKGGVQFLPFTLFETAGFQAVQDAGIGPLETGGVVDPLSYEIGSISEKSLMLGVSIGEFRGNVYGYHGDDARSDEPRSGFGAVLGYRKHVDEEDEIAFNLSFIDDLGTLAGFQEEVFGHDEEAHSAHHGADHDAHHGADHGGLPTGSDERMPGWAAATAIRYNGVTITVEYMISQDRYAPGVLAFDGRGARPAVWSLEVGYGFELAGRGGALALGYHGTSEAAGLGIPSVRYLSVVSVDLWKETLSSTLEWLHDREYGIARGGSGKNTSKFTLLLGVAF
ncbi:MAG: LbtU family siderophore porin [Gemmatimonadetes bacterium]|nr:LbtU family siderophore porin [Gemmatimonadota bacterium]